jgi:hypothetical protein
MKVKIAPKDTTDRIILEVEFTWQEGELFCIRFSDGTIRKYPFIQLWYIEIMKEKPRSK